MSQFFWCLLDAFWPIVLFRHTFRYKRVCQYKAIIYSFHERGVNTEIRYVNCNRKSGRNVYISQSVPLSTHPLHIFSLCGPYFCSISGNTFGTVCNHRSLGKLSARVSRGGRVDSGEGGRGGDRGGGHMQQVVRFSKPIEIDGFPIPWQTLSFSLSLLLSLSFPLYLRFRGRAYNTPKLLSILQRDGRRDRCESRTSAESRWRGTRELTAFITAFSPCHGFSLRHSLQAIERQAICLPFALTSLYASLWSACIL